jgi:DNA repair protein RadC
MDENPNLRPEDAITEPSEAAASFFRYHLKLIREAESGLPAPHTLSRPRETVAFLWDRFYRDIDREAFSVVYLSGHRAIGWTLAYLGTLERCSVEPRGILVPALLSNASGVIVAHNHPSGTLEPSAEDLYFTRRLQQAAEIVGIALADSLILADDGNGGCRWKSLLHAETW